MEAFTPDFGSVVTLGYSRIGAVHGISVQAREIKDSSGGGSVKGLLVDVYESEYRNARSFGDVDEISILPKGFDALLQVTSNPTPYENFEVTYKTKGDLEIIAFNTQNNKILYAVKAGRGVAAQSTGLNQFEMEKLRALFQAALQKSEH